MRALLVAAARPNFMKVKPVLDALDRRGVETHLVHTGQHHDAEMSAVFFDELGLRQPDHHLGAAAGSHAETVARVMVALEPIVDQVAPDVVIVFGDVNSTVAAALVAAKAGVRVAHVEAGLRSRDWAMPEEVNRVVTDRLSDWLLAPSADAATNLRAEGYRTDQIHVVGNVMIDTLLANLERARASDTLERLGLEEGRFCLVTLHRPSNVDDISQLRAAVEMLRDLAKSVRVVFPCHPRTAARLVDIDASGIEIIPPASYLSFVALQASSRFVLTDSGGVQEETTALGIPCLTMRTSTERPITVTEGTNRVVGTDMATVRLAIAEVLDHPPPARRPALWDGAAADRIASVLLDRPPPGRPTALSS